MAKQHPMVRFAQIMSVLFVLSGCYVVLLYSSVYSDGIVKLLNTIVPVEVNEIAAKSQRMAALSDSETYEPGSKLWVARQTYLKLVEETLKRENDLDLSLVHFRYLELKKQIQEQNEKEELENSILLRDVAEEQSSSEAIAKELDQYNVLNQHKETNQRLEKEYLDFLKTYEIKDQDISQVDPQIYEDIAYINNQQSTENEALSRPYAIVVLGGGLTLAQNKKDIVVNPYTELRLHKTLEIEKQVELPIVLSGVEAPYMQKWLAERGVDAKLLENKSMNTCENTRFSSLLLQKKGGAPTVLLVTDRYHMPRTRRLFAVNGIRTIPVEAPMPTQRTAWRFNKDNYDHSRRANYEMLASIRDMLFGSSGCREVP